jgi:hypothetical protein
VQNSGAELIADFAAWPRPRGAARSESKPVQRERVRHSVAGVSSVRFRPLDYRTGEVCPFARRQSAPDLALAPSRASVFREIAIQRRSEGGSYIAPLSIAAATLARRQLEH